MDIATATPVEIDTELARLNGIYFELTKRRGHAADVAHRLNGERMVYQGRQRVYTQPLHVTLTELAQKLAEDKILPYEVDKAREVLARIAKIDEQIEANHAEVQLIDVEYASRPWSRFISVEDGHVHSGTRCAKGTIRVTTKLGWHPELSGKTEAEAVELLGPKLCTHCFPTAPVEWTFDKKAAKPIADGYCTGQGQQGENLQMQYMSPRGNCPVCKQGTGISKTGKVLKHKKS